jgi:hypothetical protein
MGLFTPVHMARFARFASKLLTTNFVAVPPNRVDTPYDSSPLVPGDHYVRLWLAEVQHRVPSGVRYLFYSKTQFQYGDEQVAIPTFLGPSGLGLSGATARLTTNRALTRLFRCGRKFDVTSVLDRQCVTAANRLSASD